MYMSEIDENQRTGHEPHKIRKLLSITSMSIVMGHPVSYNLNSIYEGGS